MLSDGTDEQHFKIHPLMKIGYVCLNVSDVQRSVEFYQSILGFRAMGKPSGERALLSVDGNSPQLIELLRVNEREDVRKRSGLYHFAVLLPERKFLADMLLHLAEKRGQVHFDGLADHLVSESIYIRDPDHNGIEIYRDRPSSEWTWNHGQIEMATIRLDTNDLQKEATDAGWKGMPAGTAIGHMHLHVSNLAKAKKFYSEVLGLNLTTTYPGAYFFAAGRYHHHVATNNWLGTNIAAASPDRVGLNHFGIELPDSTEFENTIKHLQQHEADVSLLDAQEGTRTASLRDPDGIEMRLYHAH